MVFISLIALLSIWVSRVNFNSFTNGQKVLILSQKIISRIETVKNYAKNGYGIWVWLTTPDAWRVQLSQTGIISEYSLDNKNTWNPFPTLSYQFQNWESISLLRCKNTLAWIPEDSATSASLEFSSTGTLISGCNAPNFTELQINAQYANEKRVLSFSTLNSVIEVGKE